MQTFQTLAKNRYTGLPKFSGFQILRYENNIVQGCSDTFLFFLKYFGDKYGVRRSRFGWFVGRSRNHPNSIAIDQESLISLSGIIKKPKPPHNYIKKPRKAQTTLFFCRILGPIRPRFGINRWTWLLGPVICVTTTSDLQKLLYPMAIKQQPLKNFLRWVTICDGPFWDGPF